ncbi:nuclear transport factor 2 family protein [Shinella sp.]|uniref:nuclear transport factor 2 family protein n=1 Tax=Shinella sp. TaxID=1870904 RepID=UPI0028ACDE42|nr:nuclear transport factor 2 family protein [Shinella sp.]
MTDMEQNRALAQRLYAGFAAGDVPAVLSTMATDIEWTEAEGYPYAGTFIGPDAVVEAVFVKLATEWEGYQAVPDQFVAEKDTVVALGHYSGTYRATGRSFRAPFAHVWTVRDGKLSKFVQYTDTVVVQRALEA